MSGPANVISIDAIRDFVPAVALLQEELKAVISALQIEMQRALSWIEQDRPRYWQVQLKRAFDRVAETRTALTTCQMRTVAGRRPSCIEEKEAFSAAKRRLEYCQEQIEVVKRWGVKLRHEADEFRGRIAGCQRLAESDLTKALALLARIIESLEKYSDTFEAPTVVPPEEPSGTGGG
ncbi:MAG: hypothetical protein DWH91_17685 [Planctomycetota bacterium]|nr:MAG: hypothetical protein DWH91_17685 [Planctomycetota bacterium]